MCYLVNTVRGLTFGYAAHDSPRFLIENVGNDEIVGVLGHPGPRGCKRTGQEPGGAFAGARVRQVGTIRILSPRRRVGLHRR